MGFFAINFAARFCDAERRRIHRQIASETRSGRPLGNRSPAGKADKNLESAVSNGRQDFASSLGGDFEPQITRFQPHTAAKIWVRLPCLSRPILGLPKTPVFSPFCRKIETPKIAPISAPNTLGLACQNQGV